MSASFQDYKKELLGGDIFLQQYEAQLDELSQDPDFMKIINAIHSQSQEENADIFTEKNIAKKTLFSEGAYFDFPAYKQIVDAVKSKGYAQNSAAISTYFVMLMRKNDSNGISEGNRTQDSIPDDKTADDHSNAASPIFPPPNENELYVVLDDEVRR